MAVQVIKGTKVFIDGYQVACDLNRTDISRRVEPLDVTNFCSSGRKRMAGLQDWSLTMTGFANGTSAVPTFTRPTSQSIEPVAFNRLIGKSSAIVTIAVSSAIDSACYIGKGAGAEVTLSGRVGDVYGITAVAQGNGVLVPGKLVEYGKLSTSVFSDGSTTPNIVDLHGLSTKWSLHAVAHILGTTGADGHTMRLSIQCSSDSGFGNTHSTLFVWAQGTIDATTSPGTAKYASTKISSTKIRYVRITRKSTGSSTNAKFRMAVAVGVSRKR